MRIDIHVRIHVHLHATIMPRKGPSFKVSCLLAVDVDPICSANSFKRVQSARGRPRSNNIPCANVQGFGVPPESCWHARFKWAWVNTNGTILHLPVLEPILVGIGMFTGGTGFCPIAKFAAPCQRPNSSARTWHFSTKSRLFSALRRPRLRVCRLATKIRATNFQFHKKQLHPFPLENIFLPILHPLPPWRRLSTAKLQLEQVIPPICSTACRAPRAEPQRRRRG